MSPEELWQRQLRYDALMARRRAGFIDPQSASMYALHRAVVAELDAEAA